jgi:hypothetical protein
MPFANLRKLHCRSGIRYQEKFAVNPQEAEFSQDPENGDIPPGALGASLLRGTLVVFFDPLCPRAKGFIEGPIAGIFKAWGAQLAYAPVQMAEGALPYGERFLKESLVVPQGGLEFWEESILGHLSSPHPSILNPSVPLPPPRGWPGLSYTLENTFRLCSLLRPREALRSPTLMWLSHGAPAFLKGAPVGSLLWESLGELLLGEGKGTKVSRKAFGDQLFAQHKALMRHLLQIGGGFPRATPPKGPKSPSPGPRRPWKGPRRQGPCLKGIGKGQSQAGGHKGPSPVDGGAKIPGARGGGQDPWGKECFPRGWLGRSSPPFDPEREDFWEGPRGEAPHHLF